MGQGRVGLFVPWYSKMAPAMKFRTSIAMNIKATIILLTLWRSIN